MTLTIWHVIGILATLAVIVGVSVYSGRSVKSAADFDRGGNSGFRSQGKDAVILGHNIDSPFITQLEQRNPTIRFQRIDADVNEASGA